MTRARQTTARRLKESQETAAFLTTFNEIDMTNLMQMRKDNQEAFMKKHGVKLGFMSPFLKAVTHAAKKEPSVNAFIDGKDIVYHDFVNISVAVAAPKGLVVPVIRNCELKSFAEIEMSIGEMATKAREGTMAIEDMDGGTITVSNGGTFGSLMGTPIINPPQSAVLGMHGVFNRPVAIDGEVVIRPMMYVALTYDHRLIDGKEAVTFLRAVKEGVEDPLWMLMG
jgi:2-oxoglutarate dehydrogenase E2 component (dihydrolipoamide succinyltransferase)